MSRKYAVALMVGMLFTGPFLTAVTVALTGSWWGLTAYPAIMAWLILVTLVQSRRELQLWDTNE